MAQNILSDVRKIRQTNQAADIDVTSVVENYVKIGDEQENVEKYLKEQGFSLYSRTLPKGNESTVLGVFKERSVLGLGFHDEIRVILSVSGGKVSGVSGRLIYRSL